MYLQYITGCLCNSCEVRISPALCDVVRSLYTGTAARGSTWPTYGGCPCVLASRARPSRPSLSSLPSQTPSQAGLAASSADSDGAVLTYATHILQHHWHLCRPQAVFSPFVRSHRNVRTICTHEEWQYCVVIPEERREVMHCRRKSWFQLTTDVTQTRECVSVEYRVLANCTHAMHAGGRKASTGTPLQRSGAATPKDGHNLINATSANEGKTVLAAADIRVRRHPDPEPSFRPERPSPTLAHIHPCPHLWTSIFFKLQIAFPRAKSAFYVHLPRAGAGISESPGCN